jgi:dihydrofolate reductase
VVTVPKLIEVTHVTLGGEIGSPGEWARPYLDEEHVAYAGAILNAADALLLGRVTYEGLSAAYIQMPADPFVDRMNAIPKFVVTTTLPELAWNATPIDGEPAAAVAELKRDHNLVKYGNGMLDATLIEHGLIDEFHLLLTPIGIGRGTHLFEQIDSAPQLRLVEVTRFASGVLTLVYVPQ